MNSETGPGCLGKFLKNSLIGIASLLWTFGLAFLVVVLVILWMGNSFQDISILGFILLMLAAGAFPFALRWVLARAGVHLPF